MAAEALVVHQEAAQRRARHRARCAARAERALGLVAPARDDVEARRGKHDERIECAPRPRIVIRKTRIDPRAPARIGVFLAFK